MTNFKDRESAFENKFALDESLLFKAEARMCKLFGLWLGDKLGFSEDESKALAANIVGANLEEAGFDDVKRAIAPIIADSGVSVSDEEIDAQIAALFIEAQKQIKEEA
jgi:hypothetical protein